MDAPALGTISTSTVEKLGWKLRCRVVWSACPECGRQKWVPLKWDGKMCNACSVRIKAQPRGANAKKPGNIERQRGALNHQWKGGVKAAPKGYLVELVPPDDPMYVMAHSGGYAMQHRLVVARAIGRPLLASERVHHRDGNRSNNVLSNLELWFGPHPSGQRASDVLCDSCPYRQQGVCDEQPAGGTDADALTPAVLSRAQHDADDERGAL